MSKIQKALEEIQAKGGRKRAAQSAGLSGAGGTEVLDPDHTIALPAVDRARISIDWDALRENGLITPEREDDYLSRQLRDIKRPLIGNAFGRRAAIVERGNLIMITSSLSGEGKTFIALNLARSMANERDYTVVLVDADVAKPQTSEIFGLQNEVGLLDIIEQPEFSVETAIVDTDVPGLSVLPAGRPRRDATELLASRRMERLVNQLAAADAGRIVLFDSPPLLQTSESKVLAGFVGQIVMTVRANSTATGAVAESMDLLGDEKVVNLILNMATSEPLGARTSYGSSSHREPYGYGVTTDAEAAIGADGGEQ